jgi:hypothetical protein
MALRPPHPAQPLQRVTWRSRPYGRATIEIVSGWYAPSLTFLILCIIHQFQVNDAHTHTHPHTDNLDDEDERGREREREDH